MLWPFELQQINAKTYAFHHAGAFSSTHSLDHTHNICLHTIWYSIRLFAKQISVCFWLTICYIQNKPPDKQAHFFNGIFSKPCKIFEPHIKNNNNNDMVMVIFDHFYQSLRLKNLHFFTLQNGKKVKFHPKEKCDEHERFTRSKFTFICKLSSFKFFFGCSCSYKWEAYEKLCFSETAIENVKILRTDTYANTNAIMKQKKSTHQTDSNNRRLTFEKKIDRKNRPHHPFHYNSIQFNSIRYFIYTPFKCISCNLFRRTNHLHCVMFKKTHSACINVIVQHNRHFCD